MEPRDLKLVTLLGQANLELSRLRAEHRAFEQRQPDSEPGAAPDPLLAGAVDMRLAHQGRAEIDALLARHKT